MESATLTPPASKIETRSFVLDTNVYVDIEGDVKFESAGRAFVARNSVLVSSVVVAELLLAVDSASRTTLLRNLRGQIGIAGALTPSADDWETAALTWARIAPRTSQRRSFWNDLLLAASCARTGTTLITSNASDFARIAKHIPVRHERPWRSGSR
jgi:predicted nucleic acid-binding protein